MRRALVIRLVALAVSALGTYAYFVSVLLIPVFGFLVWRSVRALREQPAASSARFALALSVSALVIPIVAFGMFLVSDVAGWSHYPDGSVKTGADFFYPVFTPAAIAGALPLLGAALTGRRASA